MYTLGSLFDGSGGFPFAAYLCGITPIWASEIEKFPIEVTKKRFPNMQHLGDITKIDGGKIRPVDVISFGSPCQSFSVAAGKRLGLAGKSGLFYEAIRIVKEMRYATNGKSPRFIIFENVNGIFSTDRGRAFQTVLSEITQTNIPMPLYSKWPNAGMVISDAQSTAYRILDAQFWGVPQRRKRLYLVHDFNGQSAGKILFEREGLSRDFAACREAWERLAGNTENGSCSTIRAAGVDLANITSTTNRSSVAFGTPNPTLCGSGNQHVILNDQGGESIGVSYDVCSTLRAEAHGNLPCVIENNQELLNKNDCVPVCMVIRAGCDGGGKGALLSENLSLTLSTSNNQTLFVPTFKAVYQDCRGKLKTADIAYTLTSSASASARNAPLTLHPKTCATLCASCAGLNRPGGIGSEQDMYVVQEKNTDPNTHPKICGTLCGSGAGTEYTAGNCAETDLCVAYSIQGNTIDRSDTAGANGKGVNKNVCFSLNTVDKHAIMYSDSIGTLCARDCKGVGSQYVEENKCIVEKNYIVRRLMPTECAKLQGLPSWWCADVPHSDSAEYRMWGNGIALPCALYVTEGIAMELRKEETEDSTCL